MATRMVSRFYRNYTDAVHAMADLSLAGVPDADISLIESDEDARLPPGVAADSAQSPASGGAVLGGGLGGGLGVLVGIGAIGLPAGAGWMLDVGWVGPTVLGALLGAGLGAVVGSLTRLGVRNRQVHLLALGLQRGEHLVLVRTADGQAAAVEAILQPRPATP